ncbi:unnamed protein product [Urochloa decumbens]|uniref:Protein kinase domain-containing protein n=1 Tax=Urochloa decumbens TaxID=240449 RepID=A0ABC9AJ56_9POAL
MQIHPTLRLFTYFSSSLQGVLDSGTEIAIKKLHQMVGLDDVQFKKEFNNLMKLQHKNIIKLVGYCYEIRHKYVKVHGEHVLARMEERALCFEYLQRGSLDKHLSDESCGLDWHTRYKIIKGICEGLDYLHNGSKDHIYHLDLKPANILLDENIMPKISDFGLSRLFGTTQTHTTKNFIGTPGYMPPEYIDKRQISKKFDVFSLGVLIIQIMAGPLGHSKSAEMLPQKFIEHVQEQWKKTLQATSGDTTLQEADSLAVKTCIEIALRCVEADRVKRPTIREIIDKLNEIETVRKSLIGQRSECNLLERRLAIDPLELRFPFEVDRDVSCVLQLTNRSGDFVAFTAQANQSKYWTVPERGIMPPWSKRYVIATLKAQVNMPDSMQCNDLLHVQSTRVTDDDGDSATVDGLAEDFEKKMMVGNADEAWLPIVYVALPPPRSP